MAMDSFLLTLRGVFEWIDTLPSSIALRESQYVYSWVIVAHVISMCLFAGLIVIMDLRLLGVGHQHTPFSQIQIRLFPWQMLGFAISVGTGVALVYALPMRYFGSIYFWMKMAAMGLAALNAAAFHYVTHSGGGMWDSDRVPPFGARLAGALGIVLWATVVLEGRLIPYSLTWFQQEG
jgi:hypothetical protein